MLIQKSLSTGSRQGGNNEEKEDLYYLPGKKYNSCREEEN